MKALNIKRYETKLIMQLSGKHHLSSIVGRIQLIGACLSDTGGNRRKVSLAVALMGAPPTVYLDEVSYENDIDMMMI